MSVVFRGATTPKIMRNALIASETLKMSPRMYFAPSGKAPTLEAAQSVSAKQKNPPEASAMRFTRFLVKNRLLISRTSPIGPSPGPRKSKLASKDRAPGCGGCQIDFSHPVLG